MRSKRALNEHLSRKERSAKDLSDQERREELKAVIREHCRKTGIPATDLKSTRAMEILNESGKYNLADLKKYEALIRSLWVPSMNHKLVMQRIVQEDNERAHSAQA